MTRTQRLTERAITFAIAEPDEDLAVARLAFLAHGDHAALDAAIEGAWPAASAVSAPAGGRSASLPACATRTSDRCSRPASAWRPSTP